MLELVLTRWAYTDGAVLGRMGEFCTLENPWKHNQPRVSCIPTGRYRVRRDYYHRGGYVAFEVMDVPGRSEIKIHIGNTSADTAGCPLVGSQVGVLKGALAVLQSGDAYTRWMESMEGVQEAWLTVEDAP